MNAKLAKISIKPIQFRIRRVKAQDMYALARRQLKPWEDTDSTFARGGSKSCESGDAIVIGDSEYLDANVDSFVDNRLCVADRVSVGLLPPEGPAVVVRVHLKRALVETCSGRKPRIQDGIRCHSRSCHTLVSVVPGSTSLPCPDQLDSSTKY